MKSIKNINFEDALSELETIVRKIDRGDENLENIVESFERGMALKSHCEKLLADSKLKIEKITKNAKNEIEISNIDTKEIEL